jgi:hypothetical protein
VAAFPTKLSSQQLSSIHWETAKTENDDKRNLADELLYGSVTGKPLTVSEQVK